MQYVVAPFGLSKLGYKLRRNVLIDAHNEAIDNKIMELLQIIHLHR